MSATMTLAVPKRRTTWFTRALRAVGGALLTGAITIAAVLVLWAGLIWALRVPPFVGKGPIEVWNYLFVVPDASANLASVARLVGETLRDAAIGYATGLGVALLLAAIFLLIRPIEQALMPIMLVLQSIPLIALAPIIILIFGRDVLTVAVMGALVVVFPALVTIVFGLRSASPVISEVVDVYGGSKVDVLRRVALPSSVPALFAAARIAVPGAITGALIAEWLATGDGVGRAILAAVAQARMTEVWALTAAITLVSIILYAIAAAVEGAVIARMGMTVQQ